MQFLNISSVDLFSTKKRKRKKQVVRLDHTSQSDWVNREPVMESIFLHMKTGHSNNLREPLEPGFDLKNHPHCEPFQLGQVVAFILEPET